jgi:hypothetical protein
MARARVKFPLDSIGGTICGSDRTIGRDVGMASSIRQRINATAGTDRPDLKVQLYATTAPTRGGSVARHTRAQVYCDCDGAYKTLAYNKSVFLKPWWMAATGGAFVSMGAYQIYMKVCLKGLLEYQAFLRFSWLSRYQIWNRETTSWINKLIVLVDIPTYQLDGMDLEVYLLLSTTTKKGRITYSALMIDYRLTHDVMGRSTATVTIPTLQPGSSLKIDVYSYFKQG